MRKWTELTVTGCLTLAVLVACNDTSVSPTAPSPPAALTAPAAPVVPLGVQIQTAINTLYPASEASSLTHRWLNVVDELDEAQLVINKPAKYKSEIDSARARLVVAVAYAQSKTSKVIAPVGETKDHAVARLALMMSQYVYDGPGTQPSPFPAGSDVVLAIVQPSATVTTTVRTPTQHAAVQIPPGALAGARIFIISQNLTPFPTNCSGPLNTRLCQYPQFYEFSVFPDTRLLVPATVGVCHINSGNARVPLADHARFAIAHDAPANPADRVSGGTIVDGIEILPFVLVSGLTSCTGNSYQVGAAPVAPSGALGSALHWLADPAARVASAVFEHLAPREAWAIDGIGGGRVALFSDFATVDPLSRPDLNVGVAPSATESAGEGGSALEIGAWSVVNNGTAAAQGATVSIVVAADSLLTTGVITSSTLGQAASLAPGQTLAGDGVSLDLPASFAAGGYYVGIRATVNSETGLADANLPNNLQSRRVALGGTTLGSWTSWESAPLARSDAAAGAINGTIYMVGGIGPSGLLDALEAYNVELTRWSTLKGMPFAVEDPAAAALNGKLYVAGGGRDPEVAEDYILKSAFSFTPDGETWVPIAPMSVERTAASAVALNGHFLVVGGRTYETVTGALESYDPLSNSWSTKASMPTARNSAGAAVLNGILYVAGGFDGESSYPLDVLEAYDPTTDSWSTLAPMPAPRGQFCFEAINGLLYAVGGYEYTEGLGLTASVDAYDPESDSWSPRAEMPTARMPAACGVVGGSLFAIGGAVANTPFTGAVERFTP